MLFVPGNEAIFHSCVESVDSLSLGGTDVLVTSVLWSSLRATELPLSAHSAPVVEYVSVSGDLPTEGYWCPPARSVAWSVSHMPTQATSHSDERVLGPPVAAGSHPPPGSASWETSTSSGSLQLLCRLIQAKLTAQLGWLSIMRELVIFIFIM